MKISQITLAISVVFTVGSALGAEDYSQKGIRIRSFKVLPSLATSEEYDTNVFYQDPKVNKITSSFVIHFRPVLDIKSDWGRHALNFNIHSDIAEYSAIGKQANYQDVGANVDGKLDITGSNYLTGFLAYNRLHESRGSVDQIAGIDPTFYNNENINSFYNHKFNRVTLKTGVNANRYDYSNVLSSTGLALQMQSRNHWQYEPSIQLGYEIWSGYQAFVKIASQQLSYDNLVLSNGSGTAYNRNSSGYNVTGGFAFDLTDLITGDISVGYLERSYQDARLRSTGGINGFMNFKWRPTTLTTVNSKFGYDINETTQVGVSGVMASTVNLGIVHELKRNILLSLGGNFSQQDYNGYDTATPIVQNQQNRADTIYGGNVGAKYLFNRYLNTDLTYTYQNRDTNYYNSNYDVNQIMFSLRGQY